MPTAEGASVRLHYELSGEADREVLVLINSLGSSLQMWDKAISAFEQKYRVLRFDIRGHGESRGTPAPYMLDQLGRDLLFLLDELGLHRVNLCGLSLGGLISMWVGIHASERVRSMVLANTAARIGTAEAWDQRIAAVQASGMLPIASASIDRWFTPSYRDQHPVEMKLIREMIASTAVDSYAGCCQILHDADLTAEIGTIRVPCLVIAGTHDPATPPSDARSLQSALRNSKYVELHASHLSAWERHKEFADGVISFLSKEECSHG